MLCVAQNGLRCCVCVLINPPWETALVAIVFCEQAWIFMQYEFRPWRQLYITAVKAKYGLIVVCKFVAATKLTCMGENEVVSVVFLASFRAPLLLLWHPQELINFITETQHFRLWGEAVYDLNRASSVSAQTEGKIASKHLSRNLNFCLEIRD